MSVSISGISDVNDPSLEGGAGAGPPSDVVRIHANALPRVQGADLTRAHAGAVIQGQHQAPLEGQVRLRERNVEQIAISREGMAVGGLKRKGRMEIAAIHTDMVALLGITGVAPKDVVIDWDRQVAIHTGGEVSFTEGALASNPQADAIRAKTKEFYEKWTELSGLEAERPMYSGEIGGRTNGIYALNRTGNAYLGKLPTSIDKAKAKLPQQNDRRLGLAEHQRTDAIAKIDEKLADLNNGLEALQANPTPELEQRLRKIKELEALKSHFENLDMYAVALALVHAPADTDNEVDNRTEALALLEQQKQEMGEHASDPECVRYREGVAALLVGLTGGDSDQAQIDFARAIDGKGPYNVCIEQEIVRAVLTGDQMGELGKLFPPNNP